MKVVYVAHALGQGPNREANRAKAAEWVGWLAMNFDIAPIADWIVLSGQWPEEMREKGLVIDLRLIEECDELWLVGERLSPGMQIEAAHAARVGLRVRDLTNRTRESLLAVGEAS